MNLLLFTYAPLVHANCMGKLGMKDDRELCGVWNSNEFALILGGVNLVHRVVETRAGRGEEDLKTFEPIFVNAVRVGRFAGVL